ncbi:Protein of unknown function [Cotesia congregata]|uniref:Uncharacterized protein n=1 Tax=Cotesia congregata TaxID=51543 RepID=A0A8J2HUL2_COTCN|nr:Protein of unknown function [Cotesia congregata]
MLYKKKEKAMICQQINLTYPKAFVWWI